MVKSRRHGGDHRTVCTQYLLGMADPGAGTHRLHVSRMTSDPLTFLSAREPKGSRNNNSDK